MVTIKERKQRPSIIHTSNIRHTGVQELTKEAACKNEGI
jgi:hypothetical protein